MELATWVRASGAPAFLHLRTVRFLGHAGTDVEAAYRTPAEIRADCDARPDPRHGPLLVGSGVATDAGPTLARRTT